jgi:lipopolysaccharide biosynthesis glycosyltransferase
MTTLSTQTNCSDIGIVLSTDDFYVPYISTAIQSVMENASKDKQYHIYILYQSISNQSVELLEQQVAVFSQFSLDFIDVTQYIKKYKLFSSIWSIATYFRLLIPYLFPKYQKMIYIDGDIICNVDIAELFAIDLENHLLASARDSVGIGWYHSPYYNPERKEKQKLEYDILSKMKNPDNYFNAGVLVLNLEAFRNTISMKELLDFSASEEWQFPDQDILNILCEDKVLFLPMDWDFLNCNSCYLDYLPEHLRQEHIKAKENPKIAHLVIKPWNQYNDIQSIDLLFAYAPKTPFIGILLTRMYEKGLIQPFIPTEAHVLFEIENKKIKLRSIIKWVICWASRNIKIFPKI